MVLEQVRRALLTLHKSLVDAERLEFERVHGRVSAAGFVQALTSDPAFAWLRPLTTLLVEVDELIDAKGNRSKDDELQACLARLDGLLRSDAEVETGRSARQQDVEDFSRRYAELLQLSPDAVMAHGAVRQALA